MIYAQNARDMYNLSYPYMQGGYADTKEQLEIKLKYIEDIIKVLIENDDKEQQVLNVFRQKLSKIPSTRTQEIDNIINKILFEILIRKYKTFSDEDIQKNLAQIPNIMFQEDMSKRLMAYRQIQTYLDAIKQQ